MPTSSFNMKEHLFTGSTLIELDALQMNLFEEHNIKLFLGREDNGQILKELRIPQLPNRGGHKGLW